MRHVLDKIAELRKLEPPETRKTGKSPSCSKGNEWEDPGEDDQPSDLPIKNIIEVDDSNEGTPPETVKSSSRKKARTKAALTTRQAPTPKKLFRSPKKTTRKVTEERSPKDVPEIKPDPNSSSSGASKMQRLQQLRSEIGNLVQSLG